MFLLKLLVLIPWTILFTSAQGTLDDYVKQGLENNLALKQKQFSYEKSLASLDEARGMFLPSLSVNARYTRAGGGRTFEVPIGDLMNPVYTTLNLLTQSNSFPTDLPNEEFPFFREEEHETKLTLVQPIFVAKIWHNNALHKNLSLSEKSGRDTYARELVAEIKSAYYNYLTTVELVNLYDSTEVLLMENLRVSKRLVANDKATDDVVYRAEAELSKLSSEKAEAEKQRRLARSYFNFLLNRELNVEIIIDEALPELKSYDFSALENSAISGRDELKQLDYGIKAREKAVDISQSTYLPNLVFAFDYGFQGDKYRFSDEDDFWMGSLVLQWNLFNGGQDDARIQQTEIERNILSTQRSEVEKQIMLEVRDSYEMLKVAFEKIEYARKRVESSGKSFEILSKKFEQGMSRQIEYLDARNNLTQSQFSLLMAENDYMTKLATLEKSAALIDLSQFEYKY